MIETAFSFYKQIMIEEGFVFLLLK